MNTNSISAPVRTIDATEAVASVAYRASEVISIYPITPSSGMAELCDEWASANKKNIWADVPEVVQLQSEGGVAGALHGSLQVGTLATTFTASQGLLLMIPNMYKIAGELTPFVMHVSARALATHALSIFGDHSDVMACRQTGFAMLASNSVQEAQDLALIAHAATLKCRVPFLHFFDGFRTSHEINKITTIEDSVIEAMIDMDAVSRVRARSLSPDTPSIRGTAQNPDVFFQAREAANSFYDGTAETVEAEMAKFAELTGRKYSLYEYEGPEDAEDVIVIMGSGAETAAQTAQALNAQGRRTGVLKIRLYRPLDVRRFLAAIPKTVRNIAVLDRCKEPGSVGEPLFIETVAAIEEGRQCGLLPDSFCPRVIGGRYGLGSKDFTPAMVKAIYDELPKPNPKRRFTVGIMDDVTMLSLPVEENVDIEPKEQIRAVFFGLGSDGTVGANKNSVKIIGEGTDNHAQGYFVYDSKKSGGITISHLRFGPHEIRAPYLVQKASFVACHQSQFLNQYDVLDYAADGAVFLLNSIYGPDTIWSNLPNPVQEAIVAKKLQFYVIDAYKVAREAGMGGRINTIMQTCFFAISGVLEREAAIAQIKKAIEKTYGKKGPEIVQKNFAAVDQALAGLHQVQVPDSAGSGYPMPPVVAEEAPDFVQRVTAMMLQEKGDLLPVSVFRPDGVWATGTSKWEKRNIAQEIPIWDPEVCIQCNKCVQACPHAAIRSNFYPIAELESAPACFRSSDFRVRDYPGNKFTIQVAPEDCTGCSLCVSVCPAKNKKNPRDKAINMRSHAENLVEERENYDFFLQLSKPDRSNLKEDVKFTQFREPLFEYSGACAGCGETPYLKMLTQICGDRLLMANATGCSSIYGGNLPTTPYTCDANGRGPAWANSLFEDNAEFGLGMRVAVDKKQDMAKLILQQMGDAIDAELVESLLTAEQGDEAGIAAQRERVEVLKSKLKEIDTPESKRLLDLADYFVEKSVWIVGGDGWAYDIGFGGLDHVIASGRNVNILVLDTEVYSNTGGQQSKATPIGAIAKFAAAGKPAGKKDLGMIAMNYGNVYVARVSLGAKDTQTVNAFYEAMRHPGPSIIIAYSHCIAHGFNLATGFEQQKLAVETGAWPLYRYDPSRALQGENPLKLDSRAPKTPLYVYTDNEARFRMLKLKNPERAKELGRHAQEFVDERFALYERMAQPYPKAEEETEA
ncbi:pyruvate:ferredoxin (flavodoxin) oxidoreductase [Coraliomargarita parva]|uniref:pyruvate:ferredoxin (flavodoxin) oxidoreductase n=1 Tax=Coraliomargarita parva TaxID=3014050 RepID=UPI0022B36879|nr:pyruvate:ferredoxin (flavodoxin) oxidoreductase [Coraliomargarita parva]